jgi:hypothetical protein
VSEDYMAAAMEVIRKIMVREIWSDHPDNENGNSPLHNFARAFKGVGDGVPAAYAQECIDYEKKHKKDSSSIAAAGMQLQMDENGDITLIQSGSHYILISAVYAQEFRDAVNALIPAPDIPTDANQPMNVSGGSSRMSSNTPLTNKQMSMIQNELALRAIKQKR